MIHGNPQASYNYTVRDEVSNKMIECSIESPDTLAERNGLCAARLFRHLLTEHIDFLKGLEDWASTDKLQSIAVESVEGHDTADNVIDGKGDALVDNLPTRMEMKKPDYMEERSVSSGDGSEKNNRQVWVMALTLSINPRIKLKM